jgi:hypothetical protein
MRSCVRNCESLFKFGRVSAGVGEFFVIPMAGAESCQYLAAGPPVCSNSPALSR